MRKAALIVIMGTILFISTAHAGSVGGHWRDTNRDGLKDTYVQPYERTSPNSLRTDNYSYPGNYNPNKNEYTPRSNSPRENYPINPSPYERKNRGW